MSAFDREMQRALEADGEKLRQLTGEDHGPFDDDYFTLEPTDQRIVYRGYVIIYDPPPIPDRRWDWHFVHENYDGAPDSGDNRHGDAASLSDCMAEIDIIEDEASDIQKELTNMDNEPDVEGALERFGATAMRIKAERDMLVKAMRAAGGNMLNAKIALDVGDTKAKVSAQLASALKSVEDALAKLSA